MDLHDLARGRSSHLQNALGRIVAPALVMGVSSDILYPLYQQVQIHEALLTAGTPSEFVLIESPNGHDGFLIDLDQVGRPLKRFLEQTRA